MKCVVKRGTWRFHWIELRIYFRNCGLANLDVKSWISRNLVNRHLANFWDPLIPKEIRNCRSQWEISLPLPREGELSAGGLS